MLALNSALQSCPKTFHPANLDAGEFQDYMEIKFHLATGRKALRAFKGSFELDNEFGDKEYAARMDIEQNIPANSAGTFSQAWDWNRYSDQDQWIQNTALSQTKFKWLPEAIIFQDGSRLSDDESGS